MLTDVHYAIYENPSDHPNKFVVRRWHIIEGYKSPLPEDNAFIFDSYEQCLSVIPDTCIKIDRCANDDPAIREVWI